MEVNSVVLPLISILSVHQLKPGINIEICYANADFEYKMLILLMTKILLLLLWLFLNETVTAIQVLIVVHSDFVICHECCKNKRRGRVTEIVL